MHLRELKKSATKGWVLRDNNGKVQTPLISFKRNSLDINTEYSKLKVLTDEDTSQSFVKKILTRK